MTTTTDLTNLTEAELVALEREILAEISNLTGRLSESREHRTTSRAKVELERLESSKAALRAAEAEAAKYAEAKRHAEANLADLDFRAVHDESITAEDITLAKEAVRLATRRAEAKRKPVEDARREYEIDASDNVLAELTAEVVSENLAALGLDGFDVVISKRPKENPPALLPAVVISQTTPTKGYGTAKISGSVAVTLVTDDSDSDLDPGRVRSVFEDYGCTVDASIGTNGGRITFREASHEVPHLSKLSTGDLVQWGREVGEDIRKQIEHNAGYGGIDVLDDAPGLGTNADNWGVSPWFDISGVRFDIDGGNAIGHVSITYDVRSEGDATAAIERAAEASHRHLIGFITNMGKILSTEVVGVTKSPVQHRPAHEPVGAMFNIVGGSRQTFTVNLAVHTVFQPLDGAA